MSDFYRRPLPEGLIPFASPEGREIFREALAEGGMEGWFRLAEHYHTQSEPAFCALGSLVVVLNALAIDPGRTWKGPWRWYSEELLDCCDALPVVRERGMTLPRFACLARCNGLRVSLRLAESASVETLRQDIAAAAQGGPPVIVSFGRAALGQTGDGHYSPVGGWHRGRGLALVLDVARFKYPPFWVPLERLYAATATTDPDTARSRGWVTLEPDGSADTRAWRFACETPAWRAQVEAIRATLPAILARRPPTTAAELLSVLAASSDPAWPDLLVERAGSDVPARQSVRDALRATPLFEGVRDHPAGEKLVLFALAAPPALLGLLPAVTAELEAVRLGLPPPASSEVERIRGQLEALAGLPGPA